MTTKKTHGFYRERAQSAGTHLNRRHLNGGSRRRRVHRDGFTLIETIGALMLFLATVAMLAAALSTSVTSREQLREVREVDRMLGQMVDTAATLPYSTLLTGTFVPPNRCPDDTELGVRAVSCVSLLGRAYEVTWSAQPEVTSGASGGADQMRITAHTVDPRSGLTYSESRVVRAPGPGWLPGTAAVRVRITGDPASVGAFDRPLLLLSGDTFDTIVAAGIPSGGGVVLRAPAGSCQIEACRIGLRTGGVRGFDDVFMLDMNTVTGSNVVVLNDGALIDVVIGVSRLGTGALDVAAVGQTNASTGDGRRDARPVGGDVDAPHPGSVCVWTQFSNGAGPANVPYCNTAGGGASIPLGLYAPGYNYVTGAGDSSTLMPLPANTKITLWSDAFGQSDCPVIAGQTYMSGGVWETVDSHGVCSSWTWGRPSRVIAKNGTELATVDDPATSFQLTAGTYSVHELTFEPVPGRFATPATGQLNGVLWDAPRDATLCPGWGVSGCAPTWLVDDAAPAPEFDCDPGVSCLSLTDPAPHLSRVLAGEEFNTSYSWPYPAVVNGGGEELTRFRTEFVDPQTAAGTPGTFSVTVTAAPGSGELHICEVVEPEEGEGGEGGEGEGEGGEGEGEGEEGEGEEGEGEEGVEVCSLVEAGAQRIVEGPIAELEWEYVAPADGLHPLYVDSVTFTLSQGDVSRVEVMPVVAADPSELGGLPVALDAAGVVTEQDPTPDTQPTYTALPVVAWSAAGTRVSAVDLAVTSATPLALQDDGVTTAAGLAMFGVNGANIDTSSNPVVPLTIQWEVAEGTFSPLVRATVDVAISPRVAGLSASAVSGPQGTTRTVSAAALDAAGAPIGGQAIVFEAYAHSSSGLYPTSKITFSPAACVSSGDGTCGVLVDYAEDAPQGTWTLVARSGTASGSSSGQEVGATPVIRGTSPSILQGTSAELTLTVTDGSGTPFGEGTQIDIVAPDGVTVPANVWTLEDGTRTITVTVAGSVDVGDHALIVKAAGVSHLGTTAIPFVVTAAPADLHLPGEFDDTVTVPAGETADVVFEVLDSSMNPVPLTALTASITSGSGVSVTDRVTTDSLGQGVLTVLAEPGASEATVTVRFGEVQLGSFAVQVES